MPDGTLLMDRCDRHAAKIVKLREEKGQWIAHNGGGRSAFKVSSPEEIARQRKKN